LKADNAAAGADATAAAMLAARHCYGRLVAWLAWQWRDIAAAEDALGEAFAAALEHWPRDGVPVSPEGWLLTAAKRQLLVAARRQRLAEDPTLTVLWPNETDAAPEPVAIPDDRLRLLFVCAHPAIDVSVRSALMLQTVLGIDAAHIASAFLVAPQAMAKRLVRAKAKIKASGIRFEVPERDEWQPRVQAVLEAIYGAYVLDAQFSAEGHAGELAHEALYLAELVAAQLADESGDHLSHGAREDAEALGLLALLQSCQARKPARLDAAGAFVPLDEQDTARWDARLIEAAGHCLARAAKQRDPGPFQLEAAIQAAHNSRAVTGSTPWPAIVVLYEQLLQMAPTIGAQIGHAVALVHAGAPAAAGLQRLDAIEPAAVQTHQPWWAARAHLLQRDGQGAAAVQAYGRALALTADVALRDFLSRRMAQGQRPSQAHG
jgi:RNA polymerase sigma-70 factor, ECF subfamily